MTRSSENPQMNTAQPINQRGGRNPRRATRRMLVLSLGVGAVAIMMAPIAHAQIHTDKKIATVSCDDSAGPATPGCTFKVFLVPRPYNTSPACDPTLLPACQSSVTVGAAPLNACGVGGPSGTANAGSVDDLVMNAVPAGTGIASAACKAAMLALMTAQPGGFPVPSGPSFLVGSTQGTALKKGFELVSIVGSANNIPDPQGFFDICMSSSPTPNPTNSIKVVAGGPVAAANMCNLTYSMTRKIKMKTPALPAVAVVLLALGLASGGLLLRRRRQSIIG